MSITPYEVSDDIDYQKIMKSFGAQKINNNIIKKIDNPLVGDYFYAHRDLDKIISYHDKHKEFAVVSGRGVSNQMHLGHLLLYKFNKFLQDKFNAKIFVPFSEDEKYLVKDLEFSCLKDLAFSNALDIAALGFDSKKTEFMFDTVNMKQPVFNLSVKASKLLTFNMINSAFGFNKSTNVGILHYPSLQIAHILHPTESTGLPVLVPIGIDQDVFVKLSRDVAGKQKLTKPASILSRFMMGLSGEKKMSASDPNTSIYLNDSPQKVKKKIMSAFTGGRGSAAEQKEKGGNPDICSVFEYLSLFFLSDKEKKDLESDCRNGNILCGDCKKCLLNKVNKFLENHQKNRSKAEKKLDKFMEPVF